MYTSHYNNIKNHSSVKESFLYCPINSHLNSSSTEGEIQHRNVTFDSICEHMHPINVDCL